MDFGGSPLPDTINPNNFPAKLWRLVNNPANKAIRWDSHGEAIIIDQNLFERQILSPNPVTSDNADAFKTTNFSSFVRQLNLYGFRKADSTIKDHMHPAGDSRTCHYFYNPNFKRNKPELVASLKRLTVDNKAKLQAGLSVNCRPPNRYQRLSWGDNGKDRNVKRGSSSPFSPTHLESTHPYYSSKAPAMAVHNGTPVPPRYLIRGHGAGLSPTVFTTDKGISLAFNHHYAGVASNPVHIQQSLLAHANNGNPNFPTFKPSNAQYPLYPQVCPCCPPNFVTSQLTGNGHQAGSFSPHSYYQARYPVNMSGCGDHNQDVWTKEHQEVKKCDINLDAIFQIADEVMQSPPSNCLIRVVSPEKPSPVLVSFSDSCEAVLCDSPASTMQANPLSDVPIIMSVSGNASLATYEQQEDSVLSVSEHMPEDAIFEVTNDDAKQPEIIDVDISNTVSITGQAYSSCTASL